MEQIFRGQFSDGKSATSQPVRVGFAKNGVTIEVPDRAEPLLWPYGALKSSEPLTPNAIEALITYPHQPGAALFVADPRFARQLAEAAPQLTARAERWRAARPWLWAAVALFLVVGAVMALQLSPARAIASMLPESARDTVGKQVLKSFTANRRICSSPDGDRALQKLVKRLSDTVEPNGQFEVSIVDWSLMNAFAVPGENIIVTRRLIETAKSPEELAGVLAHEMGHGLALHPESGMVRALGLSALVQLFIGGGGTVSNLGVTLAQLAYTRQAEEEADEIALKMLRDAEIAPAGLAAFFRRIQQKAEERVARKSRGDEPDSRNGGGLFDLLRSHPRTENRLRRVESVEDYPTRQALSEREWSALQSICKRPAD